MSNNGNELIPLDEYLLKALNDFISSKDFSYINGEMSRSYDGSLVLVNNKPMAMFRSDNSSGYMPFIIQIGITERNAIRNPEYIEVKYGKFGKEKTLHINLGNVIKIIRDYGFLLYKRLFGFTVIQGTTYEGSVFSNAVVLYPKASFGNNPSEVEAKVNAVIQALESADPSIRNNFYILYAIHTSSTQKLYPYIVLIPKGIVNEIADLLLSKYQQIYGNVTIPPEFIPNEKVNSPELERFLSNEKLPLEVVAQAIPGTYGPYPAVLLPQGDYSQYLTGNERVINLGKNVLIVFGNPQGTPQAQQQPQQAPTPQEQQNQMEGKNIEQNNLEKTLNIELSPYIPDWLKFYLNKYGLSLIHI